MKTIQLVWFWGLVGALVLGLPSSPGQAADSISLVQSIPAETALAQPGMVHAADAWKQMFAAARSTIDLGQFYLQNIAGSPLEPAIRELEKAGARGVKIRLIVDKTMTTNDAPTYERFKKIPNLELRVYNLKPLTGGIIHAKYFVVDGRQSFVGSQNFDWKALNQIHETGVMLNNANVARQLTEIFDIDWQICATGQAPAPVTNVPGPNAAVEVVASPPQFNPADVRPAIVALKEMIKAARVSVRAMVMDYSTTGKNSGAWSEIDGELRAAARRGVRVELMISDWSTGKPNIDQVKELQRAGVAVKIAVIPKLSTGECYTYSRTMHSKLLVVDTQALWIGTSNWSRGYFEATRGVELIFRLPELAAQGDRIFETLWSSRYSEALDLDKTYVPPVRDCSDAVGK